MGAGDSALAFTTSQEAEEASRLRLLWPVESVVLTSMSDLQEEGAAALFRVRTMSAALLADTEKYDAVYFLITKLGSGMAFYSGTDSYES